MAGHELRRLIRQARLHYSNSGPTATARRGLEKLGVYGAWLVHRRRAPETFSFQGRSYPYFVHSYNATWRTERAVEVPLARAFLERSSGAGLEVGNVMSFYVPTHHLVVDKYERARGVLNADVVDYSPNERFDYILSVSTLEHVGWDESPQDPDKAGRALSHLRGLLRPPGRLFVTAPLGYNPGLDDVILDPGSAPVEEGFLRREPFRNRFAEIDKPKARELSVPRRQCFVLWVAEFEA